METEYGTAALLGFLIGMAVFGISVTILDFFKESDE